MSTKNDKNSEKSSVENRDDKVNKTDINTAEPEEKGGPKGPEPTRFGDWESNGRCTDF